MDEKLFVVCNIPKLLEKILKEMRDQSCDNMTKENLDGYDYAVEVTLNGIKEIIYSAEVDNETLIHSDKISEEYDTEEFDLHELLEILGCRVVAQNTIK